MYNDIATNEAYAVGRHLRTSPRKLNLVAGLIRGKKVDKALADLIFSKKRIAKDVHKVLLSAIGNAQNNHDLDIDALYVREAAVGKGMFLKRFHARAKGRGCQVIKKFSQIRIIVGERK
jgi:large subunit ribosomal protein L22